ncbi:hypothetical protein K402DRAFT_420401 [Aulographum hederae CBS 113979]|uniref:DUF676 domain-containing protein n=1 Tax=Aulographum hederae CBS 113979 TaxID=1176131 RepID=A0A6G1H288_9PEZI|nr:hypothetical protein K402DRAFT_420401 [Aulographum hederae CBS 113979]
MAAAAIDAGARPSRRERGSIFRPRTSRSRSRAPRDEAAGDTKVDIVVIPAIGADPHETWAHPGHREGMAWKSLYSDIPQAAVHLYSFPSQDARRNDYLFYSQDLLKYLTTRLPGLGPRHIHLAGFSTGGLILKIVLSMAFMNDGLKHANLIQSCFSVAFFGVPHYGSTVLSSAVHTDSVISGLMLKFQIGDILRSRFSPDNVGELEQWSEEFAPMTLELKKVWSFIETRDTKLRIDSPGGESKSTTIEIPIVDRRSATLSTDDLRIGCEEVVEVPSDHAHLPSFGNDPNSPAFKVYISQLAALISRISAEDGKDLDYLDGQVVVDIHMFYDVGSTGQSSIKLWSENPKLSTLLEQGPTTCLKRRLQSLRTDSIGKLPATPALAKPNIPMITVSGTETEGDLDDDEWAQTPTVVGSSTSWDMELVDSPPVSRAPTALPGADASSTGGMAFTRNHPAGLNIEGYNERADSDVDLKRFHHQKTAEKYTFPDFNRTNFRWIHIPHNLMIWVPQVFQTLAKEKNESQLHRTVLHSQAWGSKQHIARHGNPHGRFMQPSCNLFTNSNGSMKDHGAFGKLSSPIDAHQLSIYLPYLHFDTFGNLMRRNDVISNRHRQQHVHPVSNSVRKGPLEHKLIWQNLTNSANLPFHHRRSLDQYGYPTLANTSARDMDQVLYKRTRGGRPEAWDTSQPRPQHATKSYLAELWDKERSAQGKDPKSKLTFAGQTGGYYRDERSKVLMVDQLWLWVADKDTVITFFPGREEDPRDPNWRHADLRSAIYEDVNGDPKFATQCKNCFDFASLAIYYAVTVFLEKTTDNNLQIFRIFEESISEYTEQQTASFKHFRNSQLERDNMDDEEAVRETLKHLHSRDDLTALLELRDIEDELSTLKKLFDEQTSVLNQIIDCFKSIPRDDPTTSIERLKYAKLQVAKYKEQVEEMQKSCRMAQDAYQVLLDMKHKQTNIAEASLARLAAKTATEQNRAIMIFTVFTIIFLPLSFFTSLFGMNAREWSGQQSNMTLHAIFLIAGLISAAVIITALLLAFNKPIRDRARGVIRRGVKIPLRKTAIGLSFFKSRHGELESEGKYGDPDLENGRNPVEKADADYNGSIRSKGSVFKSRVDIIGTDGRPKMNVD